MIRSIGWCVALCLAGRAQGQDVSFPGDSSQRLDDGLQAALAEVDAGDGWQSERFSDEVSECLAELKSWFASSADEAPSWSWVAEDTLAPYRPPRDESPSPVEQRVDPPSAVLHGAGALFNLFWPGLGFLFVQRWFLAPLYFCAWVFAMFTPFTALVTMLRFGAVGWVIWLYFRDSRASQNSPHGEGPGAP